MLLIYTPLKTPELYGKFKMEWFAKTVNGMESFTRSFNMWENTWIAIINLTTFTPSNH